MKKWRWISKTGLPNFENEITKLRARVEALETSSRLQLDPDFYIAFENRFRGPFDVIKDRVSVYVDDLKHLANSENTVVDIGCGRGELLTVLKESGIRAIGVDSNPSSVKSLKDRGFEAYCEDLAHFFERTPSGSVAAITMLHVVEHLPFDLLLTTFQEVFKVLEPGGIFIVETPNSLNLTVGASTFWIDPTHQKPLHPEVLDFVAVRSGFTDTTIRGVTHNLDSNIDINSCFDIALIVHKSKEIL
jgi:O-antigen chain-terminating methyltransferase